MDDLAAPAELLVMPATIVRDGKIYGLGGERLSRDKPTAAPRVFDIESNRWAAWPDFRRGPHSGVRIAA